MLALLGVAAMLGATVFQQELAEAADIAKSVVIENTEANPVPVRQQGTIDVNVENGSVPVSGTVALSPAGNTVKTIPPEPAEVSGQVFLVSDLRPGVVLDREVAVSLLVVQLSDAVTELHFVGRLQEIGRHTEVVLFGPASGGQPVQVLPLTQPISVGRIGLAFCFPRDVQCTAHVSYAGTNVAP